MSGIIAGAGSSFPNDIVYLDWSVASFTVAGGSTGSPYPISGTTKSIAINPTFNLNPNNLNWVQGSGGYNLQCIPSTNTTDATVLTVQYSVDGGTTWTNAAEQLSIPGGKQNTPQGGPVTGISGTLITANSITGNAIQFRLAVTDATSPTTDALTLTNIRVTVQYFVVK